MAQIGDIVVNVLANTGQFNRRIRTTERRLKGFARNVGGITRTIGRLGTAIAGLGGVGAGAGLVIMTRQAIEMNDALGKTADKLGVATEALAGMRLAAELNGVQTRQLDLGIQRMTRRISEAALGMGEAQGAIKELGLSAQDLNQLSIDEQFGAIADAMVNVANQSDRVRLGFKLFDSEGVALINVLREGSAGLEQMRQRAIEMNVALDRVDVKKFEIAADQITLATSAMQGMKNTLAVELLPVFGLFTDKLIESATKLNDNKDAVRAFTRDIVAGLSGLIEWLRRVEVRVRQFVALWLEALAAHLRWLEAAEDGMLFLLRAIPVIGDHFEGMKGAAGQARIFIEGMAESMRLGAIAAARQGEESQTLLEIWDDAVAALDEQAETLTTIAGTQGAVTTTASEHLATELAINEALKERQRFEAEIAGIVAGTRTQAERIADKIRAVNRALREGIGDREALLEARGRLFEEFIGSLETVDQKTAKTFSDMDEFARQAANNMQNHLADFIDGGLRGFDNLLSGFVSMVRRMVAELLAQQLLRSFFGLFSGSGGFLGKIAKTFAADGANVSAGQATIVGERGRREVFIPSVPGRIAPIMAGTGGGGNVNMSVYNDFSNVGPETEARVATFVQQSNELVKAEIVDLFRRGKI